MTARRRGGGHRRFDPGPLAERLLAKYPTYAERPLAVDRSLLRWRNGRPLSFRIVDHYCVTYLSCHPCEVYGDQWFDEKAAAS